MQKLFIGTLANAPNEHFPLDAKAGTRPVAIFGKSGTGKSTLMRNQVLLAMEEGEGLTVIDPHGQLIDDLLEHIPRHRTHDVIYFKPSDLKRVGSINILGQVPLPYRSLVVSSVVTVFSRLFPNGWGQQSEYLLTNFCFALVNQKEPKSLIDVLRLIQDSEYRKKVFETQEDALLKAFYETYENEWTKDQRAKATAPILNKISAFATNPLLRSVIGQDKSSFDFREAMDSKKIILCDLSKGALGEDVSSLLGSLLVVKQYLASLSRQDTAEEDRVPHRLFIDEVHNFTHGISLDVILSEARKYRLSVTVATQTLAQLRKHNPDVLHSIFGNVGTLISFRTSGEDAQILQTEFASHISLETLPDYEFYVRTLQERDYSEGLIQSQAFRILGYPPLPNLKTNPQSKVTIIEQSNRCYTKPRIVVDYYLEKKFNDNYS